MAKETNSFKKIRRKRRWEIGNPRIADNDLEIDKGNRHSLALAGPSGGRQACPVRRRTGSERYRGRLHSRAERDSRHSEDQLSRPIRSHRRIDFDRSMLELV